jgi:hypothetical protein
MHIYSIDSNERNIVPVIISLFSILITYGLYYLLDSFGVSIPWWFEAPGILGFYGIFHNIYNKILWNKRIGSFRFSNTPNLNGSWTGYLLSSHDNFSTNIDCHLLIVQNWREIIILLETPTSKSHSVAGTILGFSDSSPELIYEYINEPMPESPENLKIHRGSCYLSIGTKTLRGNYFSGRDRANHGKIILTKE